MNLVVVGSCKTTSELAKTLNEKFNNSIVYRHDLLASFKDLIMKKTDDLKSTSNFIGSHLGDIETIDASTLSKEKLEGAKDLFSFFTEKALKAKELYEHSLVSESLNSFSKRLVTFNTASLKVINVISGILNIQMLKSFLSSINNSIVIRITEDDAKFLPITITHKEIEELTEGLNQSIYLGSFASTDALLKSEDLNSFFTTNKIKLKPEKAEAKKEDTLKIIAPRGMMIMPGMVHNMVMAAA